MISDTVQTALLAYQRDEITEHHIYLRLAGLQKDAHNRDVLTRIAADELRHAETWRLYTGQAVAPNWHKVYRCVWLCKIGGFTFGAKLMERGEDRAQANYDALPPQIVQAVAIRQDEAAHEQSLLNMLDEERMRYVGSIVLGLNDALVELTGALAGLTLALQDTRKIAMTGCITGIAASFSMAASEYLSTKTEGSRLHPLKASLYTGMTYVSTVLLLILPYLLLANYFVALGCTLAIAVGIMAVFNYYISVAQDVPFGRRFSEMAGLSLSVAALSFVVGYLLRGMGG
jgi:VIT1/CCC1 family predicted Fe2+/Mn2+ transporter